MNLVQLSGVSKVYRAGSGEIQALKKIDLRIERGTFISVVGPSGSGKTTLLNIIGCLSSPTEGEVIISGKNIHGFSRTEAAEFRGEHIGFIFQNFNLIPVLTVYENIEYPLLMVKNASGRLYREKILALLNEVGMLDQKDKYPNQLSGGQKQRVAIARALITDPVIVLADEPTANLDHETAYKVIGIMRKIRSSSNTTFIFSTHDPRIVDQAEIVYRLEDGELLKNA